MEVVYSDSLDGAVDGSASIGVVLLSAMSAVMMSGLALVGAEALAATRAQTVADGAALGAVVAGPDGARLVAAAGGGMVEQLVVTSEQADVLVRVDNAVASASADRPVARGVAGDRVGLAPAMLAALARAEDLLDTRIPVVSGYRSRAQQEQLWSRRHDNPFPVARPGNSLHESGMAIDVPLIVVERLSSVATNAGLCHPLPESDPVHFIVCPSRK